MGGADIFFVHAMHSAGAPWNPHTPVISPRPVAASTGDASRTPHERLTNASRTPHERLTTRARWALPGTRCVQNALPWCMCVALTKDLVHDARERRGSVDDRTVLRKGFFRVCKRAMSSRSAGFPPQSVGSSATRSSIRRGQVSGRPQNKHAVKYVEVFGGILRTTTEEGDRLLLVGDQGGDFLDIPNVVLGNEGS